MCLKCKHIFLLIFIISLANKGKAGYDCIFEHLSTNEGLSHGRVSGMAKDHKGFMWFATWNGINRFDGHNFKTYKPANETVQNHTSNRINKIKVDALGNIWVINYDSKAFRLNKFSEEFDPVPDNKFESTTAVATNIFTASNGDVWVQTSNLGVFHVVTDTLTNQFKTTHFHEKSDIPLPGNTVYFVKEDTQKKYLDKYQ